MNSCMVWRLRFFDLFFFSYLGGAFLAAPHGDCELLYSAVLEVISCFSRKNVILERLPLPGCVITAFAQTGALRASRPAFSRSSSSSSPRTSFPHVSGYVLQLPSPFPFPAPYPRKGEHIPWWHLLSKHVQVKSLFVALCRVYVWTRIFESAF